MPNALADLVLQSSAAAWTSILVHPEDVSQIRDALLAADGRMVTLDQRKRGVFTGVVIGQLGFLIGCTPSVPRHSVTQVAAGTNMIQLAERTLEALDRLAAGADTIALVRPPLVRSTHRQPDAG